MKKKKSNDEVDKILIYATGGTRRKARIAAAHSDISASKIIVGCLDKYLDQYIEETKEKSTSVRLEDNTDAFQNQSETLKKGESTYE